MNSGNVDKNTKSNSKIPKVSEEKADGDKVEVSENELPENHTETETRKNATSHVEKKTEGI